MKLFTKAENTADLGEKPDTTPEWYDRFFANVFKFSANVRACWIWTGAFDGDGYGMFSYGRVSKTGGRTAAQRAHRFVFEKFMGAPIPGDLVVMHMCDTPQCVNPLHLCLGTIDDNMADRNRKGRQARGERNRGARLTEAQVLEIRASTEHPNILAERYGVSAPLIYNIISRRIWRHI
jgi:hypothetical protein